MINLEGQVDLFDMLDEEIVWRKVEKSIRILQTFEPEEGYYLAFSGGKDSQTVHKLAQMAGVRFDAHYSVTSVDHPELVRFIKRDYADVSFDFPHDSTGKPVTMWNLIKNHTIPPTRHARYCCAELKKSNGKGRITVTGVRWSESVRRRDLHGIIDVNTSSRKIISDALESNESARVNSRGSLIMNDDNSESRRTVEQCYRTRKTLINPIVDWTDTDVWYFLNHIANVEHCSLYDEGYKRLGCIGCPLAGRKSMIKELARYPKIRDNYIRAFQRMKEAHPEAMTKTIKNSTIDDFPEAFENAVEGYEEGKKILAMWLGLC